MPPGVLFGVGAGYFSLVPVSIHNLRFTLELRQLLASETKGQQLALDLRNVTLVNEGAVKFLAGCEADGIKLENCPAYIREWIERVKGRIKRRRTR